MKGPIDFSRGHPSTRLLATAEIADAAAQVLHSELPQDSRAQDIHPLQYGTDRK